VIGASAIDPLADVSDGGAPLRTTPLMCNFALIIFLDR
jgi:hypothetical protein